MSRDMFFGVLASNDGGGKNGVGWGEARSNSKRGEKVELGNKGINECSGNKPPLGGEKVVRG